LIEAINGVLTQTFTVKYKDGQIARPKPQRFALHKVDERSGSPADHARHSPSSSTSHPSSSFPFPSSASTASPSPSTSSTPTHEAPLPSFSPHIEKSTHLGDPTPLVRLAAGQELIHHRICRIPTEDQVRASTLEGTEGSPIRVEHRLAVEVRYRVEGAEETKLLCMEKTAVIASWCVLSLTSSLPYSPPSSTSLPSPVELTFLLLLLLLPSTSVLSTAPASLTPSISPPTHSPHLRKSPLDHDGNVVRAIIRLRACWRVEMGRLCRFVFSHCLFSFLSAVRRGGWPHSGAVSAKAQA
jgi:hypothetical protein